jgi:probable HAF family extracellular repeat protein
MQDLGTLGGASSVAYGINESGQIVGTSTAASGVRRAFLWEEGSMRSLGALPGHQVSEARAINDSGQVVGYSRRREGDLAGPTPVLWQNGEIIALQGRLGGPQVWKLTTAVDINNRGEIAASGSYLRWSGGVLLAPAANEISGGWTRLEARYRGLRAPQVTLDGVLTIRNGSSQGIGVQRVKLYLSGDAVVDDSDTLLSNSLIPAIGPGATWPMRVHKRLSRGQNIAGRRVIAILDADNTYAEENEANNTIVSGPLQ